MNQDLEHLRLLAIFHYVLAAVTALCSLFPVAHIAFLAVFTRAIWGHGGNGLEHAVGWVLITLAGLFVLAGLALALCLALAGQKLMRQQSYTFCLVMAAVSCIFMPFGTVLGVFTILVLMRGSVRTLFGLPATQPAPT